MIPIELSKIIITLTNWKKNFICYPMQPLVHVNSNDLMNQSTSLDKIQR
jgi:hypothetical protein